MKPTLVLLLPLALAACTPDPDTETAELSAYYARKGDSMPTVLQNAGKVDAKKGKSDRPNPTASPTPAR